MTRTCRNTPTPLPSRRTINSDDRAVRALALAIVAGFTLFVVTFFFAVTVALVRWVV
jgi:hypothetical protein